LLNKLDNKILVYFKMKIILVFLSIIILTKVSNSFKLATHLTVKDITHEMDGNRVAWHLMTVFDISGKIG